VREDDRLLAEACAIADQIGDDGGPTVRDRHDARSPAERQMRALADMIHAWRGQHASRREGTPRAWGPLCILQQIGEGAFSKVFRAVDVRNGREVALKLLKCGPWPSEAIARAIIEDSRALCRVRHANVIAVYGAASHDSRMGIWMERLHGCTLEERLGRLGPVAARDAILIGLDVCRGTAAVHRAGLLHGDIKAQNVVQADDGRLVLIDIGGIAWGGGRASARPPLTGTPLCLAPEVLDRKPATVRSEVYSIGVLLYHLVTGAYPVSGRTLPDLRAAHASGRRRPLAECRPHLPGGLVAVVERALAHDPSRRYAGVPALQGALASLTGEAG
jgi:serine/threonine protein kinase